MLPIELMQLELAENNEGAIDGWFHHSGKRGKFAQSLPREEVWALLPDDSDDAARLDRDASEQVRVRMGDDEWQMLGVTPSANSTPLEPPSGLSNPWDS